MTAFRLIWTVFVRINTLNNRFFVETLDLQGILRQITKG